MAVAEVIIKSDWPTVLLSMLEALVSRVEEMEVSDPFC